MSLWVHQQGLEHLESKGQLTKQGNDAGHLGQKCHFMNVINEINQHFHDGLYYIIKKYLFLNLLFTHKPSTAD